jgi:hypothetical protein
MKIPARLLLVKVHVTISWADTVMLEGDEPSEHVAPPASHPGGVAPSATE